MLALLHVPWLSSFIGLRWKKQPLAHQDMDLMFAAIAQ
jgi:hypothetical protein